MAGPVVGPQVGLHVNLTLQLTYEDHPQWEFAGCQRTFSSAFGKYTSVELTERLV